VKARLRHPAAITPPSAPFLTSPRARRLPLPQKTVPDAINDALGTLPARADVHGLPFQAVFTYAVYTLGYVVVKVGRGGVGLCRGQGCG
jgi:hypothetical protein